MEEMQLIDMAQRGDLAAADELVGRHWRPVRRFARRLTNSSDDADDLSQDTFCRAFEQLPTFRKQENGSFQGWLIKILMNQFLNQRKNASSRRTSVKAEFADVASDVRTPARILEGRERLNEIHVGIGRLPAEQRGVLVLRVLEGKSYSEIGQIMGMTETTARWHMHQARINLRRHLGDMLHMEGRP